MKNRIDRILTKNNRSQGTVQNGTDKAKQKLVVDIVKGAEGRARNRAGP